MRRMAVVVGLCLLVLPVTAWADGIDLTNQYGTVTISNGGISTLGSELKSYGKVVADKGHSLGTVSFWTGALTSGDIWSGGTFSDVGSSFIVTGVGNKGQPKGIIFSGSFVGPISWTLQSFNGKFTYVFTLSGTIQGQAWDGRTVTGTTSQTIYVYKNQWAKDGEGGIRLGDSNLPVPEPGTLGLFGAGLILVAGAMRRKLFGA